MGLELQAVLIAVCIMMITWMSLSFVQMRQIVLWWFQRRSDQLFSESEQVRNGLLQDLFVLRRSIELSLIDDSTVSMKARQDWLEKTGKLHHELEALSNRLSLVSISLPLAIQLFVEEWKVHHSDVDLKLDLPLDWDHFFSPSHQLLLSTLDELFKWAIPPEADKMMVTLHLAASGNGGDLEVFLTYPNEATYQAIGSLRELSYLKQSFQFLTGGSCQVQRENLTMKWYFRWRM